MELSFQNIVVIDTVTEEEILNFFGDKMILPASEIFYFIKQLNGISVQQGEKIFFIFGFLFFFLLISERFLKKSNSRKLFLNSLYLQFESLSLKAKS